MRAAQKTGGWTVPELATSLPSCDDSAVLAKRRIEMQRLFLHGPARVDASGGL